MLLIIESQGGGCWLRWLASTLAFFITFGPMRPQSAPAVALCSYEPGQDGCWAGSGVPRDSPLALYVRRYLSGVEAAEAITRQVLQVYRRHGVEPLVESSVTTDVELSHVQDLLGEESEGVPGDSRLQQAAAM